MKYEVTIPKPSAKRLEKRKFFIILCHTGWGIQERERYDIPEGDETFEFEMEGPMEHRDPNMLDADWHLGFVVEYQNTTGSRKEIVKVTPREI